MPIGPTLCVVAFTIWSITLTMLGWRETPINYYYNLAVSLLYFWGAYVAFGSIFRIPIKSAIGRMLLFTGIALTLNGLANVVWAYYNLVLKVSVPYPSLADLFFLPYYPAIATAFIFLLIMVKPAMTKQRIAEVVGFFIMSFTLIYLLIRPEIPVQRMTVTNILDITYPLGDVIMLTLALLGFRLAGEKIRSILLLFIGSMMIDVGADILFSYTTKSGYYFNGSFIDLLYVFSAWLLLCGTLSIVRNFSSSSFASGQTKMPNHDFVDK